MPITSTITLTDLRLPVSLGSYGPGDVVPDAHLLDLTLGIGAEQVLLAEDGMDPVFDYDPLMAEIDRLARDGHYDTQEWLMTRILRACAAYRQIRSVEIRLKKTPVRDGTGVLGVRVAVDGADLDRFRPT